MSTTGGCAEVAAGAGGCHAHPWAANLPCHKTTQVLVRARSARKARPPCTSATRTHVHARACQTCVRAHVRCGRRTRACAPMRACACACGARTDSGRE
eukprot:130026-Chlamydomonas_euryale.AAC.2